ncbi:MAG: hypothetical protein II500_04690, partial [Campylobacter sp.]|nr:hypothetical protein [Campylobacter sp.]
MIQGLVISHIKDEKVFYKYFKKHINKIDNWALCDNFCSAIKIVEKYEDKYFKEVVDMSLSDKNLDTIFEALNKIKSDLFYINMAEAWL